MIGVFRRAKRKRAFYRTIGIGIDTCSEYFQMQAFRPFLDFPHGTAHRRSLP
jgi:hypothetical protein